MTSRQRCLGQNAVDTVVCPAGKSVRTSEKVSTWPGASLKPSGRGFGLVWEDLVTAGQRDWSPEVLQDVEELARNTKSSCPRVFQKILQQRQTDLELNFSGNETVHYTRETDSCPTPSEAPVVLILGPISLQSN